MSLFLQKLWPPTTIAFLRSARFEISQLFCFKQMYLPTMAEEEVEPKTKQLTKEKYPSRPFKYLKVIETANYTPLYGITAAPEYIEVTFMITISRSNGTHYFYSAIVLV